MRIGILGIGAIGGFLASILIQNKHDVVCICRERTCQEINNFGLILESNKFNNHTSFPETTNKLLHDIDLLFIATKSQYLEEALKLVESKYTSQALIIPLLNGVGFNRILVEHFGAQVASGTIGAIEVLKKDKRILHQSSSMIPKIELASNREDLQYKLAQSADLLKNTGIDVTICNSEAEVIWGKLLRLNAVASFTAAYQKEIGEIRVNSKLRADMKIFINESLIIAALDNYQRNVDEIIDQIDNLPSNLTTSLQRDVMVGRLSELESITGGVLKIGLKNNINLPMHLLIYNKILSQLHG
jgi:2-dehydropantoate 2-reductase